jgi:hypothetical protein
MAQVTTTNVGKQCLSFNIVLERLFFFFVNGETRLGSGYCNALLVIAHHCLPNMLTSLGLTHEEAEILRSYCDGAASVDKSLLPSVTIDAPAPTYDN